MAKKKEPKKSKFLTFLLVAAGILTIGVFTLASQNEVDYDNAEAAKKIKSQELDPNDFTTLITNRFTSLPIGRTLIYNEETEEGVEKVEISIDGETKKLTYQDKEFTTLMYRDRVWVDSNDDGDYTEDELVEDTKDYLAQNKETGDLWYFGEDVDNYEDGKLVNHEGSWLAGVDGAVPGIWVKQNPRKKERYLQEYYRGVAEDTVDVKSLNANVKINLGKFKNCLKTYDWTPLDPESREYKYYCEETVDGRKVNARVLTVNILTKEKAELVGVSDLKNKKDIDDRNDNFRFDDKKNDDDDDD